MAGGKETPRQKMIGMMYLVLTALLALNVSKSILDAFVAIEENMQQANLTELARGDEKKGALEDVKNDKTNKGASAKAEKLLEVVAEIDKWTAEEIKFIDDIKIEVLEKSGENMKLGGELAIVTEAYDAKNKPLKPTRMNLEHVQAKDQYDVPMAILIGPETDIKKPNGKGMDIWDRMLKYRTKIIERLASSQVRADTSGNVSFVEKYKFKCPDIKEFKDQTDLGKKIRAEIEKQGTVAEEDQNDIVEIYRGLTKKEFHEVHEQKGVHWVGKTYDHSPSVAAIASLTSLQKDILSARARAISLIRARVGGGEYSFNKVVPLAFGADVVNQGEDFTLSVMMAAFDTDKQPQIKLDEGTSGTTSINEGVVKVTSKSGSSNMTLSGEIGIEKKNGDVTWRKWSKDVLVISPSGSIELMDLNVLYRGYPNKVSASGSGYPTITLTGGGNVTVSKSGDHYIAKPGKAKTAYLVVSGKDKDGNNFQLKKGEYRVSNLPDPVLYWGGSKSGVKGSRSSRALLAKYTPEIPLKANFKVTKWTASAPGLKGAPPKGLGGSLAAASGLITNAPPGTALSITATVVGPDGIARQIGGSWPL